MNPIRILMVSSHGADAGVGGVGKHLMRHGLLLPERGFHVSYLAAHHEAVDPPGPTMTLHRTHWRTSQARRVTNHVMDAAAVPRRSLARAVDWARPDIVHTHSLPGISTAIWEVCRRKGVPVVHTAHDYQLLCPRVTLMRHDGETCRPHPLLCGLRSRSLTRWAGDVDLVLAPTAHVFRRHEGIFPPERQRVVPNPWDSQFMRLRERMPGDALRRLGYLGRLDHTKGLRELIAALPALADAGCEVHVAGAGRMTPDFEQAARENRNLVLHGIVRDRVKDEFIMDCDAAIIPSIWEEPGGPVEAMWEWLAAGRPVLSSMRGGLAEARDEPGVVPLEPTPVGIADAVRGLTDPAAWAAATAAAAGVPRGMDEAAWSDLHAALYREVLAARGRSVAVAR